jgi:enoyl-CoA hydratase/carnithine racemase
MSAVFAVDRPYLHRHDAGGVARLVLARPESRNPLSDGMTAALQAELDAIRDDAGVRAVVIAAEGPAFSSGHDLKEMTAARAAPDRGLAHFERAFAACARLMTSIVRLPQPVIAEVQGVAAAAGCQLVASCDLALAATGARFSTPGLSIGLFCSTPMVALSRNVARKHAMEMLLTADHVSAEDAARFGLVNRVVEPQRLRAETDALAKKLAAQPRRVVKIGKEAFYAQAEMPLDEAYAYAGRVMVENMLARDAEEGIGAFVAKRTPNWQQD